VGVRTRPGKLNRIARISLACALLLLPLGALAQSSAIWVLYPDVGQPERDAFTLMRTGIEAVAARARVEVVAIPVPENASPTEFAARIRSRPPRTIIALGRRAYLLTKAMKVETPVVVGAVDLPVGAGAEDGISLTTDPRVVIATLRTVAPQIQRVVVIADPERDRWWIDPARAAADRAGILLQLHAASTIGEAAAHYLNVFRYGNPRTDAIWLVDSGRYVTADTLPRIIEESWSRNFLVFSNTLEHVNQGALFAHYPDPRPMGERIARLAIDGNARHEMRFLEDVKRAANARVGTHLGPAVNNAQLSRFDVVLGRE